MRKGNLKMSKEQKVKLLQMLIDIQENCAPITLTIGSLSENTVEHDGVVIKEAPPVVIKELVKDGYMLDLSTDGILVEKFY